MLETSQLYNDDPYKRARSEDIDNQVEVTKASESSVADADFNVMVKMID